MSEANRLVLDILRKIDAVREAVWEEGYQAGWTHANACERDNPAEPKPTNPYTADSEQSQRDAEPKDEPEPSGIDVLLCPECGRFGPHARWCHVGRQLAGE